MPSKQKGNMYLLIVWVIQPFRAGYSKLAFEAVCVAIITYIEVIRAEKSAIYFAIDGIRALARQRYNMHVFACNMPDNPSEGWWWWTLQIVAIALSHFGAYFSKKKII